MVFLIVILAYWFSQVFNGDIILPQSLPFSPLNIHFYGLFMALAVGVGFYLAKKRARKFGIDKKTTDDIIFWLVVGGFIGARFYHVVSSHAYYLSHPLDILKVWQGGLSIYGAVFGGLLTLFLCKKFFTFHFSLFTLLNWFTPSLILGQIIGRFGNLFNYELYGYPTNLPWKMFVPEGFRWDIYQSSAFFHPLFLYEQLGLLIILATIFRLESRWASSGLFLWYLLLYNILRFGLEFLRIDSVFWGDFRVNAAVSLVLTVIALYLLKTHAGNKHTFFS